MLLLAPAAHADTGFVPIGDPATDTLQLWSAIATSIELIAQDAASAAGQVTSTVQHLASAVTAPHPKPSGSRPRTPKQLSSAIAQVASVGAIAFPETTAATQSEQSNSTELQQSRSRGPPTTDSSPIVYQLSQTPALDASAFVTQDQFNAGLSALSASLRQLISDSGQGAYYADASPPLGGGAANTIAAANAIDQLSGTTLNNVTVNGIFGLSASEIPDLSATYLPLTGGTVTGNLAVSGSFTGGSISLSSASSTNASSTNLFSSSATFSNATSTNFFATLANFTSAVATTFNASVANIVGLTVTNSTTTNATTTNLYAAVATIPSLTGTTATFSGATSTSLFATTASSTNLFSQTASFGSLTLPALSGLLEGNGASPISVVTGAAGQFPYYNGTNTLLATSSLFLASNGNVGIGTTSPITSLSVSGSEYLNGTLMVTGTTSLTTLVTSQGPEVNVLAYGAVGNGIHDDTAAIQAAINAASTTIFGQQYGGEVLVPPGNYVISSTIYISDVEGIRFIGTGLSTYFEWKGLSSTTPMFKLTDVDQGDFENFQIAAGSAYPLGVGIQSLNDGNPPTPTKTIFRNIDINGGTNYVSKGFQIGGGGIDSNNDQELFEDTDVSNYGDVAYSLENSQVYDVTFQDASCHGDNEGGRIGVSTNENAGQGGNFHWDGGFCGGNSVADFYIGSPSSGTYTISNASFEGSDRFIYVAGPTGSNVRMTVDNVRWASNDLDPDNIAIEFLAPGPLVIDNSFIGSDYTRALKISWNYDTINSGAKPTFSFENSEIATTLTTVASIFTGHPPTQIVNSVAQNSNSAGGSTILGGGLASYAGATTTVPLLVTGAPSQSADLFQAQNSAGAILANITAAGSLGIGTSSPGSVFSVQGVANFVANATSTFYNGLNTTALNVTSGTSTFANGINLTFGCFSVGGNCLTLGNFSGTLGVASGGTGSTNFSQGWIFSNGGTGPLAASTSPTVNYITATSTTATSTISGNLAFNGNSLIAIGNDTYLSHISGGGLALSGANAPPLRIQNNAGIQFVDTGGTARTTLQLDNGNVLRLEQLAAGHLIIKPASGDQIRFTNNAETLGIMTMFDSTADISLGTNADSNFKLDVNRSGSSGTFRCYDSTASTGVTTCVVREGAGQSTNPVFGVYANNGITPRLVVLNGDVGIGTTTPYSSLSVWGPDTASTSAFAVVNSASTTVFSVFDNGNSTYLGSIFQSSDQRLKADVQSLDASSSLAAIEALNPVSYFRIDQPGTNENLGFIAQAVQQIFPQLVSTTSATALTPGGTLTLNYEGLIAPMVSAIQALSAEITSIENTIADFAQSFVSNDITANNELCVGTTCVTPAQFQAMFAAANASQSSEQGSGASSSDDTEASDTQPVIQINGDNPAIVQVGTTYNDLGATITGPQADLNLGITTYVNGIETSPVQIDTSQAATDTIDYVATDQNGLTSTTTRTIIIQPVEAPSIVPPDDAGVGDTASSSPSSSSATTTATTTSS
jgi:hypothetical protein